MLNAHPRTSTAERDTDSWQAPPQASTQARAPKCRIESTALLQGSRELLIAHGSDEYRLRLTRNDKLILTK